MGRAADAEAVVGPGLKLGRAAGDEARLVFLLYLRRGIVTSELVPSRFDRVRAGSESRARQTAAVQRLEKQAATLAVELRQVPNLHQHAARDLVPTH